MLDAPGALDALLQLPLPTAENSSANAARATGTETYARSPLARGLAQSPDDRREFVAIAAILDTSVSVRTRGAKRTRLVG
jgi:hypothetical protein